MRRAAAKAVLSVLSILLLLVQVPQSVADRDTTPPELVSFDLRPTKVNIALETRYVTATVRLRDENSGIGGCDFRYLSPSGHQCYSGFRSHLY